LAEAGLKEHANQKHTFQPQKKRIGATTNTVDIEEQGMQMTQGPFDAICEWKFIDARTGKMVTARMGRPTFDSKSNKWECETEVVGLARGARTRPSWSDPFHAIIMSMERFRAIFEQEEGSYSSPAGSPYFVFPRYIPTAYGTDVHERIAGLVEDEVQKGEVELTHRREESD
jgi:hypothetical protein